MANRVLRDWTTSDAVDKISAGAEVFFTRLIMKADDFGSFHANPKLLKAALFPLKDISPTTIHGWVSECVTSGLVMAYKVDGKDYIKINNFGQRLRNMRSTFPQPADKSPQVAANGRKSPPETKRNETEEETESETETNGVCGLELIEKADGLTVNLCEYFAVSPIVTSKIYNSISDYISTLTNRNQLEAGIAAFEKYKAYKARSQEQRHGIERWMGTKDEYYQDGVWITTDWDLKNKNYNESTTRKIGTTEPQRGKDYSEQL